MVVARYHSFPSGTLSSNKIGRTGKSHSAKALSVATPVGATLDGSGNRSLLDQFRFDRDFDFISDDQSARLGQGIPDKPEVFAVDFRRCRYSGADIAPGILYGSGRTFDVEGDFLNDAANGQIAGQLEIVRAKRLDAFRPKRKGRGVGHIE